MNGHVWDNAHTREKTANRKCKQVCTKVLSLEISVSHSPRFYHKSKENTGDTFFILKFENVSGYNV